MTAGEAVFDTGLLIGATLLALLAGWLLARRSGAARLRALLREQNRMRLALRVARIGNWDLDIESNRLTWSEGTFEIFEVDRPGFGGSYEAFLNAVHPEDRDALNEAYRDSVRDHRPYSITRRLLMSDGRVKYVQEMGQTFYGAGGQPLRSLGTVQDITERTVIEKERQAALQLLRGVLNATRDIIFVKDLNFNYLACNQAFAETVGRPEEEIVGHNDADWFKDPAMVESFRKWDRKILAEGRQHYIEEWATYPDGRRMPIETLKTPFYSPEGNLIGLIGVSRDITARQQAEAARQASEYRLQAAVNLSHIGIFDSDHATETIYWSPEARNLFGWSADTVVGLEGFMACLHPDDRGPVRDAILRSHDPAGDGVYRATYRTARPDGEYRWIEAHGQTAFDGEGAARRSARTIGAVLDVTERRQSGLARIQSEQRLQAAIDVAQIGIFDHDQVADTLYWSPQQREIHGFGPDEPVNLARFLTVVHPEDLAAVGPAVQRAHDPRGDGLFDVAHRIIRRGGAVRWLKDRSRTFFEGEGPSRHPVRTIGAVMDITREKEAEEEQQKLVSIIESSSDFIAYASLDGRVSYLNSAGARLVGLHQTDANGRHLSEFLTEEEVAVLESEVMASLEQTGTWRGEFELRHFGGANPIPVEMNAAIVRDKASGQPIALANISRDITERKRAEAEREALLGEMEARNAELERFTYTVSHDLRSPLITIKGFLGYLETDARDGNVERLADDVKRIAAAADRMERLLRELLDLSRIGRVPNTPEPVPFEEIVREAVELVDGRLRTRGVRVEIGADLPWVQADRVRLVEVVQNILDNSAKFMGDEPQPLIEVGFRGLDERGMPIIFIRDNGIGIDSAYQEKVFGLFDKLDKASEGSGVGLAVVKRIIEIHGGSIWIESAGAGSGTTTCFTMPFPPQATQKSASS